MQKEIVVRCRQAGKPVIVASHLLQSMIEYPTPTRAEVCPILSTQEGGTSRVLSCWDIASVPAVSNICLSCNDSVQIGASALMLSCSYMPSRIRI